jgi:ankyrin repeat protein
VREPRGGTFGYFPCVQVLTFTGATHETFDGSKADKFLKTTATGTSESYLARMFSWDGFSKFVTHLESLRASETEDDCDAVDAPEPTPCPGDGSDKEDAAGSSAQAQTVSPPPTSAAAQGSASEESKSDDPAPRVVKREYIPGDHLNRSLARWRDSRGNSLAHYAAIAPHPGWMKLLHEAGVDVNAPNETGATPLMLATCRPGPAGALGYLLRYGGCDRTATDIRKRTALHYAGEFGCGDAAVCLLRFKETAAINGKDLNGRTALHAAAGGVIRSYRDAPQAMAIQRLHCVAAFLRAGARLSAGDEFGVTPLEYAFRSRNDEVAYLLLVSGASPISKRYIGDYTVMPAVFRRCGVTPKDAADDIDTEKKYPDHTYGYRGSGDGITGLALALRAMSNSWDLPTDVEEGPAGWAGISEAAAVRVRGHVTTLLQLCAEELHDKGEESGSVSSVVLGSVSYHEGGAAEEEPPADLVKSHFSSGKVQPWEYLLYVAFTGGYLTQALMACSVDRGVRTARNLLIAALGESLATKVGLRPGAKVDTPATAPGQLVDFSGIPLNNDALKAFCSKVAESLLPASSKIENMAVLAEIDASGYGFQYARLAADLARGAVTYDGSSAHDFQGWDMSKSYDATTGVSSDSVALLIARRALGAANMVEIMSLLSRAARFDNAPVIRALTPFALDAHGEDIPGDHPQRSAVMVWGGEATVLLSAVCKDASERPHPAGAVDWDEHAVTAALDLEKAFDDPEGKDTAEERADKNVKRAVRITHATFTRLRVYHRALREVWRRKEADRMCKSIAGRECNPRLGCIDPTAGCAFQ